MASETSTMSSEQDDGTVPAAHRGLQLALCPESHSSNSSTSVSPDSNSSVSNMSETEAGSSPDIHLLESRVNERSPVDNLYNSTLTHCDVLCSTTMNANQTFTATAVNDGVNFWNENLSLSGNEDSGSKRYQTFCNYTDGADSNAGTSPDSTENDSCSLSSGEMIIRSNSFCLEEQAHLVVSSLDESSFSAAVELGPFPAESNLPSTALPDVCEKSPNRVAEENTGHPCLGVTFTQADNWELPAEENDGALSSPLVALPSENEGGLLMTFICETPENCGKEAKCAEREPAPAFLGAITPEEGKSFVTPQSAVQEKERHIQTSTPQNIGNKSSNLPSFSESPCCGTANTPGLHPPRPNQIALTPGQHAIGGLTPSASKVKKMEIKKFPKSDFSNVKSKIITRTSNQITAPGSTSQRKASKVNVNNKPFEAHKGAVNTKMSPGGGATAVSAAAKMLSDFQRRVNKKIAVLGEAVKRSPVAERQDEPQPPAAECSDATCEAEQAASQQPGSETARLSSSEKSPDRGGQIGPQPAPNKVVSGENEVGSGSALGPNNPPVPKTRPLCSSEGSPASQTAKEKRPALKVSTSLTAPRAGTQQGQTKASKLSCSAQRKRVTHTKEANGSAESLPREVKKINLVEELSKSTTAGSSVEDGKSRLRAQAPLKQSRGNLLSQTPAARPRLRSLSASLRPGDLGRDECRTPKAGAPPQSMQKSIAGSNRVQPAGEPSKRTLTAAGIKLQLNGSRPPHTPTRPSLMGPPPTPTSRPRKTPGASRGLGEASEQSHGAGDAKVSGGAAPKSTPFKSVLRGRLLSTPGKNTGPACKLTSATSKGASSFTATPLKRSASARLIQPTSSVPVDKNKSKASSRQQQQQQQPPPQQPQPPPPAASQPNQSNAPPDVVPPAGVAEDGRRDQVVQQLRGLLAAGNCRFEAVAIVLQNILAERDEATKQCRELSQELVSLQGELVCSAHSSERLEKEKEELRVSLDDALHRVQEQHQKDLAELEQRLQAFYQAEWDKVHDSYQEEADKCRALMQQQQDELKTKHEAMKLELEKSHDEQLQCVKQQYETSLDELKQVHSQELQSLDKTLKDAETSLSGRIQELTEENDALMEKLTAEESRREELAQRSQKDSHTLYLEQELESLKVVLEIKTEQLHQQEKKLMEIDKLTEKNVKLDESLNKVQQENEDLKARMERHAALSRQLSTEQAVLQESLHKESKVNKRLSMENEELLWKLNNGDLSSPRKASPSSSSSPSHSFSLHSPRSSGLFSSPPVSPR